MKHYSYIAGLFLLFLLTMSMCTLKDAKADIDLYQLSANVLLAADWSQTLHIVESPDFEEKNKILGRNPSRGEVNTYFLSAIILTNLIGEFALDEKKRKYFYIGVSAVQAKSVIRNYNMGVRFRF